MTFAFNGGPGSAQRVAAPRPARPAPGRLRRRRRPAAAALRAARQPRDPARRLRPRLHRPDLDRLLAGRRGRYPEDYHGYSRRHRVGRGADPAVDARATGAGCQPKFVAGESYGTTARPRPWPTTCRTRYGHVPQRRSCSSPASSTSARSTSTARNDRATSTSCPPTPPSPTSTAGTAAGRSPTVLAEAEAYAARDYPWALSRGHRLTAAERAEAVATAGQADRAHPRTTSTAPTCGSSTGASSPSCCATSGLAVGRLDAPVHRPAGGAQRREHRRRPVHRRHHRARMPPPGTTTSAPSSATRATCAYELLTDAGHQAWSFKEFEGQAGRRHRPGWPGPCGPTPHLRVHVAYGYLRRRHPVLRGAGRVRPPGGAARAPGQRRAPYYEAGHMMYVHEPSRVRQSADLADFVRRASGG